jgi:hypothetical protein
VVAQQGGQEKTDLLCYLNAVLRLFQKFRFDFFASACTDKVSVNGTNPPTYKLWWHSKADKKRQIYFVI